MITCLVKYPIIISVLISLSNCLLLLRDNPEVPLMLIYLHAENVKQSEVNLVDVESVVLVLAMLTPLEDVHIETVRIVRTVVAPSLDGTVVVSVPTEGEAAKRCH